MYNTLQILDKILEGKKNLHIICTNLNLQVIGLMSRMFINGPGDWGSIPD